MNHTTTRRLDRIEAALSHREYNPIVWIYRSDGSARPAQYGADWITAEAFADVRSRSSRLLILIPDNGRNEAGV